MTEQIVFPEINYDKVDTIRGLDIVICTSANNNEEAKEFLKGFKIALQELKKKERKKWQKFAW